MNIIYLKKIIRQDEPGKGYIYNLEKEDEIEIIDNESGELLCTIRSADLPEKTLKMFRRIREGGTASTFEVPEAAGLMREYRVEKIKASSATKTDILGVVEDNVKSDAVLGFSIKSQVGGSATLLNASKRTNFRYEIRDCNVNGVNNFDGPKARVLEIIRRGGAIVFDGIKSDVFRENLELFDSAFPKMLAGVLLDYYLGRGVDMKDLCEKLTDGEFSGRATEYKMKNFLRAVALGMVPGKPWDTRLESYGGYIVVKNDGELVCYHLYNDDDFKDYLFESTKFDTPSTSRHDFGYIYEEDGKKYIDLNLQIRFRR